MSEKVGNQIASMKVCEVGLGRDINWPCTGSIPIQWGMSLAIIVACAEWPQGMQSSKRAGSSLLRISHKTDFAQSGALGCGQGLGYVLVAQGFVAADMQVGLGRFGGLGVQAGQEFFGRDLRFVPVVIAIGR